MTEFDHVVIHIDDWAACTNFYRDVLGATVVDNPEGSGNPLGSVVFRIGELQINVHGPWPGKPAPCCPPPFNTVGATDLAFRTQRTATENIDMLTALGIAVVEGPVPRFGFRGWGTSVYCEDPSGNGVELISYASSDGDTTDQAPAPD